MDLNAPSTCPTCGVPRPRIQLCSDCGCSRSEHDITKYKTVNGTYRGKCLHYLMQDGELKRCPCDLFVPPETLEKEGKQ